MDWFFYAIACPACLLALALGACVIHWANKHGQLGALRQSVKSWFGRSTPPPESELLESRPETSSQRPWPQT